MSCRSSPRQLRRLTLGAAAVFTFLGVTPRPSLSQDSDLFVFAGSSSSHLTPAPDPFWTEYSGRRAATIGAGVRVSLGRVLALRGELLYGERGASTGRLFRIDIGYIDVPILLEFSPLGDTPVRPFLTLGVAGALEVRCSGYQVGTFNTVPPPPQPLDCDQFRRVTGDIGPVLGLGGAASLTWIEFLVELRRLEWQRDFTWFGSAMRSTSLLVGVSVF